MNTNLRVLVVEDSITAQRMVQCMLEPRGGVDFTIQECVNLTDALRTLQERGTDVVILDLTLPESTGVETVSRVRALDRDIPIVVFTGCEDENLAMAAMHLGADDFLVKSEVRQGSLLARTLIYAVEKKRARIALDRYAVEMERLAEARAQQLLHQDRLATIGTMSAGVAHEFKNPLCYIASNTRALGTAWQDVVELLDTCLQEGIGDAGEIEYLKQDVPVMLQDIQGGVDRIVEISDGLKSFARKSATEPEDRCLEDLIDSSLLLCHNLLKYGITVEKDYGLSRMCLPLRAQMILQVLVNLFTNAAQAMGGQGVLNIRTEERDTEVVVVVTDTGPGIDDEAKGKIFEPFFTTKPDGEGTGLGLSICRTIMEEHGGSLAVEERQEGGARFVMSLPRVPHEGPTEHAGELGLCDDKILA